MIFRNGNRCDLRRENLIEGNRSDISRRRKTNPTSGLYGVYQRKDSPYWVAVVYDPVSRRQVKLGVSFKTCEKAALCRDAFARLLHGATAKLNYPEKVIDARQYPIYRSLTWLFDIDQCGLTSTADDHLDCGVPPGYVEP